MRVKKEEYTSLGDFIRQSFVRDQAAMMHRFPKFNADFLADFTTVLEEVKILESGFVLTEDQRKITASLFAEASILNKELNFLKSYINHAGMESDLIPELKEDLVRDNIEGALFRIESLKQYVTVHLLSLVNEGMAANFPEILEAHKISLAEKNALQNEFMNKRRALTDSNKVKYKELYDFIVKIAEAGKLVFEGTVAANKYSLTKNINRMRAARHAEKNKAA